MSPHFQDQVLEVAHTLVKLLLWTALIIVASPFAVIGFCYELAAGGFRGGSAFYELVTEF